MGIRESLEKPGEEVLNLKNFVVPEDEPKDELGFDVEKEITDKDWQMMNKDLSKKHPPKVERFDNGITFCSQLILMKIVSSDKVSNISADDWAWNKLDVNLNGYLKQQRWEGYSNLLTKAKALFPNKFSELTIAENWPSMKEEIAENQSINTPGSWHDFFSQARAMKIIAPDKVSDLGLNENAWNKIKSSLERNRREKRWSDFAWVAEQIRILFPERTSEIKLDKEAWTGMKNELKKDRETKDWYLFASHASKMKTLAAKEIKFTDHGLELIMPERENFKPKTTPRPERRK